MSSNAGECDRHPARVTERGENAWRIQMIVSVHRMVMENRPVDPGSIHGSHRPISFIRIKHRTRADDILCKTEY